MKKSVYSKGRIELTSSSSSWRVLLNIQFVTVLLWPMPSWSAASRTDARRALDSRLVSDGSAFDDVVWFAVCARAGRGIGALWRGNVKFAFMVGGKERKDRTS